MALMCKRLTGCVTLELFIFKSVGLMERERGHENCVRTSWRRCFEGDYEGEDKAANVSTLELAFLKLPTKTFDATPLYSYGKNLVFNYRDLSTCTSSCLRTFMYSTVIFFFFPSASRTWQIVVVSTRRRQTMDTFTHPSVCQTQRELSAWCHQLVNNVEKKTKRGSALCVVIDGGSASRHCRTQLRPTQRSTNLQIVT